MRTPGHLRRCDGDGNRTVFRDDLVARTRNDHQVPMRSRLENVPALVKEIGPNPAADVRPALCKITKQLHARSAAKVGFGPVHSPPTPKEAQSAICDELTRAAYREAVRHSSCGCH